MKLAGLATSLLFLQGIRFGLSLEDGFRFHSSLLRKSLQSLDDLEQNESIQGKMEKLDAILSTQADLNELGGGDTPVELDTLSSALDSLGELLETIQNSGVPEDMQDVVGDTKSELKKAKDASGELESKLYTKKEDQDIPSFLLHNDNDASKAKPKSRRDLTAEGRRRNRRLEVDALGGLHSHPRFRSHFDMHEAMANGDISYLKRKAQALGNKISWATDGHRRLDVGTDTAAKKEQCQQLVDCASAMSVYDLVLFFNADDIDFDEGEFDDADEIDNFDADKTSVVFSDAMSKREKIIKYLQLAQNEINGDDQNLANCDLLLQQFHRNVEGEQAVQWVPATVIDVCRSQGTADYIKLAGDGGLVEAFDGDERIADYLFEDLVLCSKQIYDNRPPEYASEEFVFIGETNGKKFLRVPTEVDSEALDEHGRIDDLTTNEGFFKYETQNFYEAFLGNPFLLFWTDIGGLVLDSTITNCQNDLNDFYTNILLSYDSLTALGTDGTSTLREYTNLIINCKNFTTSFGCPVTAEDPSSVPSGISVPTSCNDFAFAPTTFISGFILFSCLANGSKSILL